MLLNMQIKINFVSIDRVLRFSRFPEQLCIIRGSLHFFAILDQFLLSNVVVIQNGGFAMVKRRQLQEWLLFFL